MDGNSELASNQLAGTASGSVGSQPASASESSTAPLLTQSSHDEHYNASSGFQTVKRVRLDSGGAYSRRSTRSHSADRMTSASTRDTSTMDSDSQRGESSPPEVTLHMSPAHQMPNKITIHVKTSKPAVGDSPPQPEPSSQTIMDSSPGPLCTEDAVSVNGDAETVSVASSRTARGASTASVDEDMPNGESAADTKRSTAEEADAPGSPIEIEPGSSPSVPIEIDDLEDIEDDDAFESIEVEGDEHTVPQFLQRFPYMSNTPNPAMMAEQIVRHLDTETNIDQELLRNFTNWFSEHERIFSSLSKTQWHRLYYKHSALWHNVSVIVARLFAKDLGPNYSEMQLQKELPAFYRAYMILTCRLLYVSVHMTLQPPATLFSNPLSLAHLHLQQLRFLLWPETIGMRRPIPESHAMTLSRLKQQIPLFMLQNREMAMGLLQKYFDLCLGTLRESGDSAFGLVQSLGIAVKTFATIWSDVGMSSRTTTPKETYTKMMLQSFYALNEKLREAVDKQNDSLSCDLRRDLMVIVGLLLEKLAQNDETCLKRLSETYIHPYHVDGEFPYPPTISLVWKLLCLNHYLCNGRMELRVTAVEIMGQELVNFFNDQREDASIVRSETVTPAFHVVANVLVKEKMIDYIIGPSTHPEIVRRSGNIVGFLVVTNNFQQEAIDRAWQTLLSTEDPRISAHILNSLNFVTRSLTQPPENRMLMVKVVEEPLLTVSAEAVELIKVLVVKQREQIGGERYEMDKHFDDLDYLLKTCVWVMCRYTSLAAPPRHFKEVFQMCIETLSMISPYMSDDHRQLFYADCIEKSKFQPKSEFVYMQAIFLVIQHQGRDAVQLAPELLPLCMESFCAFTSGRRNASGTASPHGQRPHIHEEPEFRLQLIFHLLSRSQDALSAEATSTFWDHLFGSLAYDNESRDHAWSILTMFAIDKSSIARRHTLGAFYGPYLETVRSEHMVPAFVQFAVHLAKINLREIVDGCHGADGILKIPTVELVWRTMISSPDGVGEDITGRFFSNLYLNRTEIERISGESLEANHSSLVRSCIKRLDDAYAYLKSAESATLELAGDAMDTDAADISSAPVEEMAFRRVISFLISMVLGVRRRPDLIVSPGSSEEPEPERLDSPVISGERFIVKYQVHTHTKQTPQQELTIGDLDTRKDLHQRLSKLTGLAKFKVIWGGGYFYLMEDASQFLRDIPAATKQGLLLVKEDASDPMAIHESSSTHARTLFEKDILREFETLYKFMDGEELMTVNTFELLRHFEPHESICLLVANESSDPEEVFPVNHSYKIQYSLQCLQSLLRDQTRQKTQQQEQSIDQDFIVHSLRLLENLLVERPLPDDGAERAKFLYICTQTVPIWEAFLKELETSDESPFRSGQACVERLLAVLQLLLQSPTSAGVAAHAYELVVAVCFVCPAGWATFKASRLLSVLHQNMLLLNPNSHIRGNVMSAIKAKLWRSQQSAYQVPHISESELVKFYWEVVTGLICLSGNARSNAMEIFSLALELFSLRYEKRKEELAERDLNEVDTLQTDWVEYLMKYERMEFVGREETDHVLSGFCTLIHRCLKLLNGSMDADLLNDLADHLWKGVLFPGVPSDDQDALEVEKPLLDGPTRVTVYRLFKDITLKHSFESCGRVAKLVRKATADTDDPTRWSLDRTQMIRSESGYLGIRNLSNTCYMNSLVTQLFMNPEFRQFMLAQKSEGSNKPHLLRETQQLFGNLQNSYSAWGEAHNFVRQIVTFAGEAIDVREQMDVEEFFSLLFDQWEESLPDSAAKLAFRSIYGGKIMYQVKSKECNHVSERDDHFFNIPCDVQGKANLYESLQAFCAGDLMQGDNKYRCEQCDGKLVDAVRRSCLKTIPDHMILHLKRFEYDIGLQQRKKINDLFEFPMEIDMGPYTAEALSAPDVTAKEDKFELVGVLVHKGQADHGHYVSYIRARPSQYGRPPMWLLFDDHDVTVFDPAGIPDECYGGPVHGKLQDDSQSYKNHSAYMLFYQRSSTIAVEHSMFPAVQKDLFNAKLPEETEQVIAMSNACTLQAYCLLGDPHQLFIRDLAVELRDGSHEDKRHDHQSSMIDAIFHTIYRVSARLKDNAYYFELMQILTEVVHRCDYCSGLVFGWAALCVPEFSDLLVRCVFMKMRHQMQSFFLTALRRLRDRPDFYGIDVASESPCWDQNRSGALLQMTEILKTMSTDQAHFTAKGFEEFFGLIARIAEKDQEAWVFITNGFVETILQILVLHFRTELRVLYPKIVGLIDKKGPCFNNLLDCLCVLLKHVDFNRSFLSNNPMDRLKTWDPETKTLALSISESKMINIHNEEGIVWLSRAFDKWDNGRGTPVFAPAEALRLLLLHNKDINIPFSAGRTLKEGIEAGSETCIRSALTYLEYCPNRTMITSIVKAMDKTVQEEDLAHGQYYMEYYSALRILENRNLSDGDDAPLKYSTELGLRCYLFGPPLLTYEDEEVRNSTKELLYDVLLKYAPMADLTADEPTMEERERMIIVRRLFNRCWLRTRDLLENESPKSFLGPLMQVLHQCAEYIGQVIEMGDNANIMKDERDELCIDNFEVAQVAYEAAPVAAEDELVQSAMSDFSDPSDDDVQLDGMETT